MGRDVVVDVNVELDKLLAVQPELGEPPVEED
jgi:hypothetical protein